MDALPLVVSENLINRFKYWGNGQIQEGMSYRDGLFCLVAQFELPRRQQAYDLAWSLQQQDQYAIVTATKTSYGVWVSLRSPEYQPEVESTQLSAIDHQCLVAA